MKEIFLRNSNYKCRHISEIKEFVDVDDFKHQVINRLKEGNWNRWIGGIYKYIYEEQLDFADYKMYKELTIEDNGVYVIADCNGDILYIGKSDNNTSHVFTRLFDHLVPVKSEEYPNGQGDKINNTPDIWDKEISSGRRLKILICCNVNFDPELLEVYLIAKYKLKYGCYPKYNKSTAKPFNKKSLADSIINYTEFLLNL